MRIMETKVYQFSELSEPAKAKAIDWYRQCEEEDFDPEWVIEDAKRMGEIMGIEIGTHPVRLMSGKDRRDPSIWWSLDYSHYPGASFDGTWERNKTDAETLIREEAPEDAELHRIADILAGQTPGTSAKIELDELRMQIEVFDENDDEITNTEVPEALRDFARWIFKAIEAEFTYRLSDEAIEEAIEANEYEFTENGERI